MINNYKQSGMKKKNMNKKRRKTKKGRECDQIEKQISFDKSGCKYCKEWYKINNEKEKAWKTMLEKNLNDNMGSKESEGKKKISIKYAIKSQMYK